LSAEVIVDKVAKNYKTGHGVIWAVKEASFTVSKEDFVVLLGPSGSGKSTVLSIIAGLDRPSQGRVVVAGVDISQASWGELNLMRRRLIGYAPQADIAIMKTNVEFNIALPLFLRGYKKDAALGEARRVAEKLGLGHTVKRFPSTLSGGEFRRLAVARALVVRPTLLLLDEPTSSLDEDTAVRVWSVIDEYHKENRSTVIVATHDKHVLKFATKIIEARNGVIKESKMTEKRHV